MIVTIFVSHKRVYCDSQNCLPDSQLSFLGYAESHKEYESSDNLPCWKITYHWDCSFRRREAGARTGTNNKLWIPTKGLWYVHATHFCFTGDGSRANISWSLPVIRLLTGFKFPFLLMQTLQLYNTYNILGVLLTIPMQKRMNKSSHGTSVQLWSSRGFHSRLELLCEKREMRLKTL